MARAIGAWEIQVSKQRSDELKSRMTVTPREFTVASALAVLSGVTITVGGCSDDSGSPTGPSAAPDFGSVGAVSANHGHTAIITGAQMTAGNAVSLDITGSATHPHSVDVTGAQLQQISAGGTVLVTSSSNTGHDHVVTFS